MEHRTSERIEQVSKPVMCPTCGGKPVARIQRGMPNYSQKLMDDLAAGKVVLGGCVVTDDDPQWKCTQCGQEIWVTHEYGFRV